MARSRQKASLFSQKIDRVAFITYFLGAIVPLVALGLVVEHYALPALADRNASLGLIGLVVSVAVLSLASFLVLRNMTRRTLARMDRDNRRLTSLLRVSGRLASAQHVTEATSTAAKCAVELAQAPAAFVFVREGEKPALAEVAGDDAAARYEEIREPLEAMVHLVLRQGAPAMRGPSKEGARGPRFAAAAVPLPGQDRTLGALAVIRPGAAPAFGAPEVDALKTLAALAAVALHNADLRDAQRNFFSHVTDMLVTALDAHLGFNAGHGNRVAQLANRMGRTLGLDEARLQRLHFSSLLHDIGMLKLDRNQQMNPRTCSKHCVLGFRMLTRIRLWKDIAPIVQHHHEWWDGSGYPEGLAGESIPLESRIIGLCDAFDTMSNDASYKPTVSISEAVEELKRCSGTQFDPTLVDAFCQLVEQGVIASS